MSRDSCSVTLGESAKKQVEEWVVVMREWLEGEGGIKLESARERPLLWRG